MTTRESNPRDEQQPSIRSGGFVDSHGFFALILMFMFAVAIVLSIIGFTTPSWLGFS